MTASAMADNSKKKSVVELSSHPGPLCVHEIERGASMIVRMDPTVLQ